jgi:hypothetical protein
MENKVTVIAKDGEATVRIGADMIVLKDCTEATFHTKMLDEFIRYVDGGGGSYNVYANDKSLHAYSCNVVEYGTVPYAICNLEYHPKLTFLTNFIKSSNKVYLKEMEMLLDCLKDGLCSKGVQLLKNLKDLKLSVITDIDRQKDNRGNFVNSIKRTVRGKEEKGEYEFPEKIQFTLPLFNYDVHQVTIEVELKFEYAEADLSYAMMWNLVNFDLDTQLNELCKAYIMSKLEVNKDIVRYWGVFNKVPQTDAWCYKQNLVDKPSL